MTKEEITNKVFDKVNALLPVQFRGAILSYNKLPKHWKVTARFTVTNPIAKEELINKFKGSEIKIANINKKEPPDYFTVVCLYGDANPT